MSSTSFARWIPPKALRDLLLSTDAKIVDPSPAMERISRIGFEDVTQRLLRGGNGDWAPLAESTIRRHGLHTVGVGKGGGFVSTLRRDWSKSNAVVFTRAPHAHLFEDGTAAHSSGGKRITVYKGKSKATARKILATATSSTQQPARPFMYFSDQVKEKAGPIILAHIFDAFEKLAA